jgi:uncharacterized protein (DUF433 family)
MEKSKLRKRDIFDERESNAAYVLSGWRGRDPLLLEVPYPQTEFYSVVSKSLPTYESASDQIRMLMRKLCRVHPGISISEDVLGGEPHIAGTRLSVAHVLAYIYHLGSVAAVVDKFRETHISGDQIKEALKYAHDFMEIACDPSSEDDD